MNDIRQLSYDMIDELYNEVLNKVQQIQDDKGYISTQNPNCDKMYFYGYEDTSGYNMLEGIIGGVRAYGKDLQILGSVQPISFDEEDFEYASTSYEDNFETEDWEYCWQSIKRNDFINLIPTLFSIAEVIEEYGTEE